MVAATAAAESCDGARDGSPDRSPRVSGVEPAMTFSRRTQRRRPGRSRPRTEVLEARLALAAEVDGFAPDLDATPPPLAVAAVDPAPGAILDASPAALAV